MSDEILTEQEIRKTLTEISKFMDFSMFEKIINKITNYGEVLTDGKLATIINFNYNLNRYESQMITDFLSKSRAISKLYIMPIKGTVGLGEEYISNVITNPHRPESIAAHVSMVNILENKMVKQKHQYNNATNKSNVNQCVLISELRKHIGTHDFNEKISLKTQNIYIMATLHDAYVIKLHQGGWWNNNNYRKYFINDDNNENRLIQVSTRVPHLSLEEINHQVSEALKIFAEIDTAKSKSEVKKPPQIKYTAPQEKPRPEFQDKMLSTPFGMHYGKRIDTILLGIFHSNSEELSDEIKDSVSNSFNNFKETNNMYLNSEATIKLCTWLIADKIDFQTFVETFLKKEYHSQKELISNFTNHLFKSFFELKFKDIFKIIKHPEHIAFACTFIVKRIYLNYGEDIPTYGLFLISAASNFDKNQNL